MGKWCDGIICTVVRVRSDLLCLNHALAIDLALPFGLVNQVQEILFCLLVLLIPADFKQFFLTIVPSGKTRFTVPTSTSLMISIDGWGRESDFDEERRRLVCDTRQRNIKSHTHEQRIAINQNSSRHLANSSVSFFCSSSL